MHTEPEELQAAPTSATPAFGCGNSPQDNNKLREEQSDTEKHKAGHYETGSKSSTFKTKQKAKNQIQFLTKPENKLLLNKNIQTESLLILGCR